MGRGACSAVLRRAAHRAVRSARYALRCAASTPSTCSTSHQLRTLGEAAAAQHAVP